MWCYDTSTTYWTIINAFFTSSVGGYSDFINKINELTRFYKGRLNLVEAMEQPIGFLHTLYYMAAKLSATDEGKKQIQAEAMNDMMGGLG